MEEGGGGGAQEEPSPPPPTEAEPPPRRRSRAWLWTALVLLAVAIVGVLIGSRLGGLTGPLSSQVGGSGRPTIVVATAAPAPSVAVIAASPSAVLSTGVAGATQEAAGTEYVVQPGDTLQSIAEQQYGDAGLWPRIYDANRDAIGSNPDALVAGTKLQLPPRQ